MLKLALPITLAAALAGLVTGSAPALATAAKKAPAKGAAKKSRGTKAKAAAKLSASKSGKKSGKKKPVRSWRTGQQQPTPERYREIQEALAGRGYLEGPATGTWGPESVEALKKFQLDQNLKGDGKLDSLSMIALGLGPKRTANLPTKELP